ncbi:hypothetical protein CROQUDRAFT_15117, partial [Cronartium quercuum f. sp. fusiforme G11]
TAGGLMYWLWKLILTQMEGDDIEKHINTLLTYYDRLNSLVTKDNPLTPDAILTTALFISLPPDWTTMVTPPMQQLQVSSAEVIRALRNESVRRQLGQLHESEPTSVVKTATSTSEKKRCTFCDRDGHTLEECYSAASILKKNQRANRRGGGNASHPARSGPSHQRPNSPNQHRDGTKAGKMAVVTLGGQSDESDSSSDGEKVPTSARLVKLSANRAVQKGKPTDWLVDSGCGKSMSPESCLLTNTKLDRTTVHLADDSTIQSTSRGVAKLPFQTTTPVPALLVPKRHEHLLSVAGLCGNGYEVLFMKDGCSFHQGGEIHKPLTPSATGERRGDLYYLPTEVDKI